MRSHNKPFAIILLLGLTIGSNSVAAQTRKPLELSRPVHSWEFASATGTRAGIFGDETGRFEAWVYPLKILRDFHLRFHVSGLTLPAETLARTITVRPETTSIVYASDTFAIRETLFVPVHEAGAVILLDIDTTEPVEVEAIFQRDFQLEWPAAVEGGYMYWDAGLKAFVSNDELKKFEALVGSPTATQAQGEYSTNYSESRESSFRLGTANKGHETKIIVIAASSKNPNEAEATYHHLTSSYESLLKDSSEYYRAYLDQTLNLKLPDEQLQQAYDWSRVSMVQGLVANPTLGTGLVAGYRTSGDSRRPGFAWFFGRDALWTTLALDAAGDFTTSKAALEFLGKYQRQDGKVPHEVAQSADYVPWFTNYPYPYASADATPLYLIAANDYVARSGDIAFARDHWTTLWSAYRFLRSTYDEQGLPQNQGVGHGWVEGGPLLPVKTEFYQAALGTEALRSLSALAHAVGKDDVSKDLEQQFQTQKTKLEPAFWVGDQNTYAFALDKDNHQIATTSTLATVPMWFGLLDETKSEKVIDQLASPDFQTDWGMRLISSSNPNYTPGGYHNGSVWPLFTGWASTGEYRYHRAEAAYANLRANALLTQNGSLGHIAEVLSGDYHQPTIGGVSSQVWSSAMVVNPLLRGLLGLEVNALTHEIKFEPHFPAGWRAAELENLRAGTATLDVKYARTADSIELVSEARDSSDCTMTFSPAISLRAQVTRVEINNQKTAFKVRASANDQHVAVQFPACSGKHKIVIHLRNDFAVGYTSHLPPLGSKSLGLRIVRESWSPTRDRLVLGVAGLSGQKYQLDILQSGQVRSVEGGEIIEAAEGQAKLWIAFPPGSSEKYSTQNIIFNFKSADTIAPK